MTFFTFDLEKYVSLSGANIPNFIVFSKTLSLAALLCLAGVTDSYAKSEINEISQPSQSGIIDRKLTSTQTFGHRELRPQNTFDIFVPKPPTLNTKFDYTVWDKALSSSVVQMGPSLRRFARKARPNIGTRLVKKSQSSPYRLEGSRVTFHYFPDDYLEALTEYKQDLLQLAHKHDIQSFKRNEQLAFWINLHNVVLIEAIAKEHPIANPSALTFGAKAESLHLAKLITIKNVPLSLKNIRENIVYENWDDPAVIYGFFRGDIGGPGLMPFAVTAENVQYVLATHGFEYITSLRGFHTTKKERKISTLYNEARSYFFQNWPLDIETHFKGYLQDHYLLKQLEQDKPWGFIEYDTIIADLWGGDNSLGSASSLSTQGSRTVPPILYARERKIRTLKRKGLLKRNYTVTVEDIETEDNALPE